MSMEKQNPEKLSGKNYILKNIKRNLGKKNNNRFHKALVYKERWGHYLPTSLFHWLVFIMVFLQMIPTQTWRENVCN